MTLAATFAGHGLRQRRRAHPARQRLPDRGPGPGLPPRGLPADEPMVPHGMSVSLTAPEAFRFTFDAAPERHLRAAALLAPDADEPDDPAELLPSVLVALMRDIGIPNGIGAVGYDRGGHPRPGGRHDEAAAAAGHRPRPVTEDDIAGIFARSLELW